MKQEIHQRLAALRELMANYNIQGIIVPQADPHQGEYLAPHWQFRRWLSGFSGSAGDLVVTMNGAALWTDSRYFLQAAQQLEGTGIVLMKDGLEGTPSMGEYLVAELAQGSTAGIDGMLFAPAVVHALEAVLATKDIKVRTDIDAADTLWADRPALPDGKIFVHELKYTGESAAAKMDRIRKEAAAKGADSTFLAMLDDIAWTLNIRSNDVKHTPVATAFLYIGKDNATLFIDPAKLDEATLKYLAAEGVHTLGYTEVKNFLGALPEGETVLVDAAHTAMGLLDILGNKAMDGGFTPAAVFKSVKNATQLDGIRNAMARDGVAMVRSLMEIEQRMAVGTPTTELDIAEILRRHRAKGQFFFDESFGTIAGYGPHGAIVHYEANAESSSTLKPEGLLLIDSGAQYLDGTTDITRTIALGTPTADEKRDFTLVMKGHIALARAVFPAGTRGAQLDALARQFLWQHGLTYLHGTGHGVGHFLSVHEGPHSIRLNNVEMPLREGTITSNEPGLYRENIHGIRCENLVLCQHRMTTDFGEFLGFETLTLCPFDRSLFDTAIMTAEEIQWLNDYHATVAEKLMPLMETEAEKEWLTNHTQKI